MQNGHKRLSNEIKIRRLEAQILMIRENKEKKTTPIRGRLASAIPRRIEAIKFLKTAKEDIKWADLIKRFGFSYHTYLAQGGLK